MAVFSESYKTVKKIAKKNSVWLNYTFEELNMVSFQNVYLWSLKKKHPSVTSTVVAPGSFVNLYNHASKKFALPDSYLDAYDNLQNHVEFKHAGWKQEKALLRKFAKRIAFAVEVSPQVILKYTPPFIYHRLPFLIKAHGRSRKYYLNSGFRKRSLKLNRKRDPVIEATSNFNSQTLGFGRAHNQATFFDNNFRTLASMIESGAGYSRSYLEASYVLDAQGLSFQQKKDLALILEFVATNRKTVLLRTRNKKIASTNNADLTILAELLDLSQKFGYRILNVGAPAMEIEHSVVTNLSHSLPPTMLMNLGSKFNFVATSCGGDFFTGWACVPYSLILFDEEWSLHNLKTPVSLIEARRKAGISDVKLGDESGKPLEHLFI